MEFIVRISEDKYIKQGLAANYAQSAKIMLEAIDPELERHSSEWREKRYFKEEVDDVLKNFKLVLEHLFQKYSKKKSVAGQKKFVSLSEFGELVQQSGIIGDKFSERDINVTYNLAMMT